MERWFTRILITLLDSVLLFWGMKYFFLYFTPFIIGGILASLINPLVNWVEDYLNCKRGFAVFFVLTFIITILITILLLGISHIYLELNHLLDELPDYSTMGKQLQWLVNQNYKIQDFINSLDISTPLKKALNDNLQLLYNEIKNGLVVITNNLLNILSKLPLILSVLFITFIATFFISRDVDLINRFILGLFPPELTAKIFRVEKGLVSSAIGFIRAEVILIFITGLISGIGLALFGCPYAFSIGLTTALMDLIPIIGPALLFIPWIVINLLMQNIKVAFQLLLLYTLMVAIRQGVEAKVMGSSLGIHPLATMIALYLGYRLLGAIGFIIGPALLVIAKATYQAGLLPFDFYFRE